MSIFLSVDCGCWNYCRHWGQGEGVWHFFFYIAIFHSPAFRTFGFILQNKLCSIAPSTMTKEKKFFRAIVKRKLCKCQLGQSNSPEALCFAGWNFITKATWEQFAREKIKLKSQPSRNSTWYRPQHQLSYVEMWSEGTLNNLGSALQTWQKLPLWHWDT